MFWLQSHFSYCMIRYAPGLVVQMIVMIPFVNCSYAKTQLLQSLWDNSLWTLLYIPEIVAFVYLYHQKLGRARCLYQLGDINARTWYGIHCRTILIILGPGIVSLFCEQVAMFDVFLHGSEIFPCHDLEADVWFLWFSVFLLSICSSFFSWCFSVKKICLWRP